MGTMREDVFLGKTEIYNKKLEILAKIAQPEKWTYHKIQDSDPYRILRNYIQFTYNRIDEEDKFIYSTDKKYRCMNTGLLTIYNQEIVAIFAVNDMKDKQPWFFNGFFKETDKFFTRNFSVLPPLADYGSNVRELIFDTSLELNLKKEHIIDDNFERFVEAGYSDKTLISVLLDSAKATLEEYYEGVTVLPVEWAYMNSRLIAKPDEEWAKIMDEIHLINDEETIQNLVDNAE